MRSLLCALALLALTPAAALAGAQQADDVDLMQIDDPSTLAAHDGRLAWSVRQDDGRWALVTRPAAATGAVEPVPVPTRGTAFDVDLGPGEDGRTVAVYSRCRRETTDPRGCDLYEYDFAAQRERRIDGASSATADETDPTVWRDRLAFQRRYDRKRAYPYLYVRPRTGEGTSQRVPGGQRKECRRDRRRQVCTDPTRSRAEGLELYGRNLAFTWKYAAFAEGFAADLRLVRFGGSRYVVDRAGRGGLTQVEPEHPAFESGALYWIRTCVGDPGGCAGRAGQRRVAIGARAIRGVRSPSDVYGFDRTAGAGWAITGRCEFGPPDAEPCRLRRLDPVFIG